MNVFSFRRNLLIALPVGLLALTTAASATTITGSSNITGAANVTSTAINFNPTFGVPAGATNTGSFAGLTGGTIGILNQPVDTPLNVVGFATFNVSGPTPIFFDLKNVSAGLDQPGASVAACSTNIGVCAPPGSPLALSNIPGGGVFAQLALQGIGYTGTSGSGSSPTIAGFTAQFVIPGLNVSTLLAQLGAGTCTVCIGASYSATFTATPPNATPEPSAASLLFMGLALVAGSGMIRRYRRS